MIEKVKKIIKESPYDGWLIYTHENKDPYFKKIISDNSMIASIGYITSNTCTVFIHSLDADNFIDSNYDDLIIYGSHKSLKDSIIEFFQNNRDTKIALNFSTLSDVNVDTIGHGAFLYLEDILKSIRDFTLNSAESLIYALLDKKTDDELHKMSIAARRANEILTEAFTKVKIGMTEKELVSLVQGIKKRSKPSYFLAEGVVNEDYSWKSEICPIALTGVSFVKGGHAQSSNIKVEPGNTVYFDFGVKLTFEDGSSWSSDIQRVAYVLKEGEINAPNEIQQRFEDIVNSISLGIDKISVGMRGYEADYIVRNFLNMKGYPDYDHATGHAIGELAHNPGTLLSNRKTGLSSMKIQENGVYTIEPRIPIENGVSVEEMVVIKAMGKNYTLCERQKSLILIDGR